MDITKEQFAKICAEKRAENIYHNEMAGSMSPWCNAEATPSQIMAELFDISVAVADEMIDEAQ